MSAAPSTAAPFLQGIRVLDLGSFLAGPFGTQLLSDMGADVVKIESRTGDSARIIPPHFVDGDSAYFHAVNRNKRSVQLDLKDRRGIELFLRMVESSDVVLDNFRPGVMSRLGLGVERLHAVNPQIISCSISGFGGEGPRSTSPAYDAVIQALSGGMSLTGHPGAPPARMGLPIGDLAAGMYGALGVLGALVRRGREGIGEHIDVAMFDSQIALLVYQAAYHLLSKEVPGPQGSGHISIPTYRAFLCGDGRYAMVTANTERMWQGLCQALRLPDLARDPRFVTNAHRLEHAKALWDALEPAFASETSHAILKRLSDAGVPAAPLHNVAEALADEQTAVRKMVVRLQGRDSEDLEVAGNPIKAAGMRSEDDFRMASRLGADTEDLLRDVVGLQQTEIAALSKAGVVGPFGDTL